MPSLRSFLCLLVVCVTVVSAAGTSPSTSSNLQTTMSTTALTSSILATSVTVPESSFTVALSLLSTPSSIQSSAPSKTYVVQVGNGDHKFKPDVIQAAVGDVVEFDFYPVNHSVIRAEYQHPCIPYEMTGKGKVGFWSGFHAVDVVLDDPPKYTVRVNDTNPVFFYCSAPDSCTKQGMVGVINPNASTSLATQRQLALQASYQLSPGESFPSEAETPSSSTLPDGSSLPPSGTSKLTPGAIAGIAIACASVVLLGALLAFFWGRLKTLKDELKRKDSTVVRSTEPRNTWFLTRPQTSPQSPQPWPSPPYETQAMHSPMSSHAVPPAYYESPAQYTDVSSPPRNANLAPGTSTDASSRVSRAASHRSVGGTFEWSPVAGYYTRTHESANAELDKYVPLRTSDMTSPVDPELARSGDLQRIVRTPEMREGYIDEKGRLVGRHVNREDPAEMPDTSVQGGRYF